MSVHQPTLQAARLLESLGQRVTSAALSRRMGVSQSTLFVRLAKLRDAGLIGPAEVGSPPGCSDAELAIRIAAVSEARSRVNRPLLRIELSIALKGVGG